MTKLIRDMVPLIALADGEELNTRSANDEEFLFYLKEKLQEESQELMDAVDSGDVDLIREEIADVYEVIKTIGENFRIDSVEDIARHRRSARGSYNDRTILDQDLHVSPRSN